MKESRKILVFGAGKIGRSFIGQVFSRGGYEVVFADAVKSIVDLLNEYRKYNVVIRDDVPQVIPVENVRALHISDRQSIAGEISDVELIAVCVGQQGLRDVAEIIAEALVDKWKRFPDKCTDVILAENLRDASTFFAGEMGKYLPDDFPIHEKVGLIETSIGKMVPIISTEMTKEDPLQVFAESYNTLIVDGKEFKNAIPPVPDLAPKENIKAWVDRKLFIHNMGHAMAAYFGNCHFPEKEYMYEVLEDPEIENLTRSAMQQSGNILMAVHPGEFTRQEIEDHIEDLIKRFKNRYLGDTVYRVGCDLKRKLGEGDRIATPLKFAVLHGLSFDAILKGYECALTFRAPGPDGKENAEDRKIREFCENNGLARALEEISGLDPGAILKY